MSSYRLRNWPEYERALETRGSIALFFSPETLRRWRAEARPADAVRRRGHPVVSSAEAIIALLMLKAYFHMGLRETVGLARSLFSVLALPLAVPDHTTLARGRRTLPATRHRPLHLVVDSTGVQLRGEAAGASAAGAAG